MKTKPLPYRRWHAEDAVRAAYLAGQGASSAEIARILGGTTAERIRSMCREHGTKLQRFPTTPAIQQIVWKKTDQDALNAAADALDREPCELAALILRRALERKLGRDLVHEMDVVGI